MRLEKFLQASFMLLGRAALGRWPGRDKRGGGATPVETTVQRRAGENTSLLALITTNLVSSGEKKKPKVQSKNYGCLFT